MANRMDRIDQIKVASPCSADWDQMSGDDRMRFCDLCNLHVYNISHLSRKEAEALITGAEGRLCARLFQRADGTVITKDCPVGLRALRKRAAKVAGAACTVVLSIFSSVSSRSGVNSSASDRPAAYLSRNSPTLPVAANWASVAGTITDPAGAAIEGATITLINLQTKQKQVVKSDKEGQYKFVVSQFGSYSIRIEAPYFQRYDRALSLHLSDDLRVDVALSLGPLMGEVVTVELPRKGFDLDGVHVRINKK
jgi:hypothetical protein